jgi:hypothetical protein
MGARVEQAEAVNAGRDAVTVATHQSLAHLGTPSASLTTNLAGSEVPTPGHAVIIGRQTSEPAPRLATRRPRRQGIGQRCTDLERRYVINRECE